MQSPIEPLQPNDMGKEPDDNDEQPEVSIFEKMF